MRLLDALATTARQYEAEGLDWAPIDHAWRAARQRHTGAVVATQAGYGMPDFPQAFRLDAQTESLVRKAVGLLEG